MTRKNFTENTLQNRGSSRITYCWECTFYRLFRLKYSISRSLLTIAGINDVSIMEKQCILTAVHRPSPPLIFPAPWIGTDLINRIFQVSQDSATFLRRPAPLARARDSANQSLIFPLFLLSFTTLSFSLLHCPSTSRIFCCGESSPLFLYLHLIYRENLFSLVLLTFSWGEVICLIKGGGRSKSNFLIFNASMSRR